MDGRRSRGYTAGMRAPLPAALLLLGLWLLPALPARSERRAPAPGRSDASGESVDALLMALQTSAKDLGDPLLQIMEKREVAEAPRLRADLALHSIAQNASKLVPAASLPEGDVYREVVALVESANLARVHTQPGSNDAAATAAGIRRVIERIEGVTRQVAVHAVGGQREQAGQALSAHLTLLESRFPDQARRVRAAFEGRDPQELATATAALEKAAGSDAGGRELAESMRRYAYVESLLTPTVRRRPLDVASIPAPGEGEPAPEGAEVENGIARLMGKARTATLAALSEMPMLAAWAQPRLDEAMERDLARAEGLAPGAMPRRRGRMGFRDGHGRELTLEDVADRFLAASCRQDTPYGTVLTFLQQVVLARGHTEQDPETFWETVRRGKLLDSEGFRWSGGQAKTANLAGTPGLTGSYEDWADLDHFAQSLAGAANWDGDTLTNILMAFGYKSQATALNERFGQGLWPGSVFSESMARLQNGAWTGGKVLGMVRGSRPDWVQFNASERGTDYAASLRGSLARTGEFCEGVARRREAPAPASQDSLALQVP